MYGSIGFTRRDKTPQHWRGDYRLNPKTKQMLAQISSEREALFREFESLPDDISDEQYLIAERELRKKLDTMLVQEDRVRLANR
ncbi:hypothetical protein [Paenibacillus macerans]|uniref:hypothetical protein n=1 Tax=Paenibacillus macerans TaxID=44252 RepID=UPI00203FA51E|nr:hypothetical protein [Paenibacillus macerans]MCM3701409.1 hypothetical protein [Paenibacillus macerans]